MKTKRLKSEHSEHARAFLARIVREDFKGNESEAARKIGISQSGLHEFLAGTRGAGLNFLDPIADYARVSVDVVRGKARPDLMPLKMHTDWSVARSEAGRAHPEIPAYYLDLVGDGVLPGAPREHIDAPLVAGLAAQIQAADARAVARKQSA